MFATRAPHAAGPPRFRQMNVNRPAATAGDRLIAPGTEGRQQRYRNPCSSLCARPEVPVHGEGPSCCCVAGHALGMARLLTSGGQPAPGVRKGTGKPHRWGPAQPSPP